MKPNLEEVSVFWGKDSLLKGIMNSEGIFRLDGRVEGEIYHKGILIVGETAVIKGKIEATTLILNGILEGDVTAKERMEIHARGKLYGTIFTPIFVMQEGGIFEGNCKMGAKSDHENKLAG
jgi:cytoskeletal protein CcmA (bactofilin family)